jgi:hypothetical protein
LIGRLALIAAFFLYPGVAFAGTVIDRAVQCLKTSPVCVEGGGALAPADARALRGEIVHLGAGPMFIAVLPASAVDRAGGSAGKVLTILHDGLGRRGTYAVVAGPSFRAAATRGFPHAPPLAEAAFNGRSGRGVQAVLADFVRRVAEAKQSGGVSRDFAPTGGPGGDTGGGGGGGGSSGGPVLAVLGLAALGGGAFFLNGRRQRRLREERRPAEVKPVARDDLEALGGEDVRVDGVYYDDP